MSRTTVAVCIAAMIATTGAALAQEFSNIVIAGEVVARIRTAGPYGTVYLRQAKIDQAIVEAMSSEIDNIFNRATDGPNLSVARVDGLWTLSIGNVRLIQAHPQDATGGASTQDVIMQWKENFFRQLPKGVSPMKVPQWWRDAHPDAQVQIQARAHGMPDEDLPLVREVAEILHEGRNMSEADFARLSPNMERLLIEQIWDYRNPGCGPAPLESHPRVRGALLRARGLDEAAYRADRWWAAGFTITKLREALNMPAGVGPVPEQRDLPDFEAIPEPPVEPVTPPVAPDTTPPTPPVEPPAPRPEDLLEQVSIGTGLGPDNSLLNVGQQFDAEVAQIMVYLKVADAPQNTIISVALHQGENIMARRLVRVSGNQPFAVTFYPGGTSFPSADYQCRVTINGEEVRSIPFRVRPGTTSVLEG